MFFAESLNLNGEIFFEKNVKKKFYFLFPKSVSQIKKSYTIPRSHWASIPELEQCLYPEKPGLADGQIPLDQGEEEEECKLD